MRVLEQMCLAVGGGIVRRGPSRHQKPANVAIEVREDCDFVKVLDSASPGGPAGAAAAALTVAANVIQGTPAFMARKPWQRRSGYPHGHLCDRLRSLWLSQGSWCSPHAMALLSRARTGTAAPGRDRGNFMALDAVILSCLSKDRERRPPWRHLIKNSGSRISDPWTGTARDGGVPHLPAARLREDLTV